MSDLFTHVCRRGETADACKPREELIRNLAELRTRLADVSEELVQLKSRDDSQPSRMVSEADSARQYLLQSGISRIFETVVTSVDDEAFGEVCLEVAEKITDSGISFIGTVDSDGLLHNLAISNSAWRAYSLCDRQCRRKPPGNFKIHGIYGRVLADGKPLLTNNPTGHPDRIGLPPGHPPLSAFLGVPLKLDGKTIGIVAVANRKGGYGPEERKALETLAPVIAAAMARRRAERALRDREREETRQRRFLEALLDTTNSCIAVMTGYELRYALVNKAYQSLRPEMPMTGRRYREVFPDAVASGAEKLVQRVIETGESQMDFGYPVSIPGKPDATWDHQIVRLPQLEGEDPSALIITWDSTEHKRAQDALRKSEARYRDLVQNANSAIIRWRADGVITFFNEYAQALFGYSLREAVGQPVSILVPHQESTGADLRGLVRDIVENPQNYLSNINENVCRDGRRIWMNWTNRAVLNEQGEVWEILAIGNDITMLKETEKALQISNTHLKLLTTVAQQLLQAEDSQTSVEELCRFVMEHIDCQFFFNYLVDLSGRCLRLNAWAGISAEAADSIRQFDFGSAVSGCAALNGKSIVAEHICDSTDVRTQVFKSFGVQAYCCHPMLFQGELIGTLSFGTKTRKAFTADEIDLMKAVTDKVAMAMQRLLATKALRESQAHLKASLAEKEVLLKEIHHRVKNNLQVISSLVDLQADELGNDAAGSVLQEVADRVRSMAMVHEKLYQSTDLARVEFDDYTQSLLGYLMRGHGAQEARIRLDLDLTPVSLPVNAAVPCGLILNELFNNALKHAFAGRSDGRVRVSLHSDAHDRVRLSVEDNGIGLPQEFEWQKAGSLGLRLVQMLAGQLHAALDVYSGNGTGTKFTILFERPKT